MDRLTRYVKETYAYRYTKEEYAMGLGGDYKELLEVIWGLHKPIKMTIKKGKLTIDGKTSVGHHNITMYDDAIFYDKSSMQNTNNCIEVKINGAKVVVERGH